MKRDGFTLIELLIVVGILGVLTAIAVPSYRDAMIRSRVAKAKLELRTLGFGLQNYRLDHNIFPRRKSELLFFAAYLLPDLTSPIAYLNPALIKDPFGPVQEFEVRKVTGDFGPELMAGIPLVKNSYTYTPYYSYALIYGIPELRREGFVVASVGPDQQDSYIMDYPFPAFYRFPGDSVRDSVYDPTNGIISPGDIGYFGGDLPVQGLIGG